MESTIDEGTLHAGNPTHWLAAMRDGSAPLPSVEAALGLRLARVEPGLVEVALAPEPRWLNAAGFLHGGYLAAVLDSTTGWAVLTRLDPGQVCPHVHLSVQPLRAVWRPDAGLRCVARAVRVGRTVAAAEADVLDGDRLVARATSTHAVTTHAALRAAPNPTTEDR